MPEIVYETVLDNATALPAGGRVQSNVVDVNGARAVNVMFGIPGIDPNVQWSVHFGPTTNNAFAQTHAGVFDLDNTVALSVPVFGPGLLLVIENRGIQDETVDGKIYFIRDLPLPSRNGCRPSSPADDERHPSSCATRGARDHARRVFGLTPTRAFRSA